MITNDDDIVRTTIDLPEDQIRGLAAYCAREQISRAEAVRRAVGQLIGEPAQSRARRRAALEGVFGMWKDRGIDGVGYQRALRAEWEPD